MEQPPKPVQAAKPKSKTMWIVAAVIIIVLVVGVVAFMLTRPSGAADRTVLMWENPRNSCGTSTECGYDPATLSVARGTTVQWKDDGGQPHTATSCHPDFSPQTTYCPNGTSSALKFDTGTINSDQTSSIITIDAEPGTYYYYCIIHPTVMHGTISVTA